MEILLFCRYTANGLCLDYAQSGIGSNSCGPVLSEKYQLNQNHFEFDMTLIWK